MTETNYQVLIKNSAKGDLKKLKNSPLRQQFENIVAQLKVNPYEVNQSFEKLVPPAAGKYSRRLNSQHRVVYRVNKNDKTVGIFSAWTHYE
jgi:Txe/YoeB family toxin of toxin-antitoxin system